MFMRFAQNSNRDQKGIFTSMRNKFGPEPKKSHFDNSNRFGSQ